MGERDELVRRLEGVPTEVRQAVRGLANGALRHRPAAGEWSAIEVVGHLIDKMEAWRGRVEAVAPGGRPHLPPYDQDGDVERHGYQDGDVRVLLARLDGACRAFADTLRGVPNEALANVGVHGEYGEITLAGCVELPLASIPDHLDQLRRAAAATGT